MADSFADLWSSPTPVQQPRKLADLAAAQPQPTQPRKTNDAFSLLATPTYTSRSVSPAQNTAPKPAKSNGDAFSGLLSGTFTSNGNGANMTMAERAAKAEREKSVMLLKQQQAVKAQAAAWSGLDSLGSSPAPSSSSSQNHSDVDWIFDNPAPTTKPDTKVTTATHDGEDDWGLSDFVSAPAATRPSKSQSLWDEEPRRSGTPGDFDFGNREDKLLGDDSNDEDDLLGMLAKPADKIPRRPSPVCSYISITF